MPKVEAAPLKNTPEQGYAGSFLNYANNSAPLLSEKNRPYVPVTVLPEVEKKSPIDAVKR
jgi:hypothetical protein